MSFQWMIESIGLDGTSPAASVPDAPPEATGFVASVLGFKLDALSDQTIGRLVLILCFALPLLVHQVLAYVFKMSYVAMPSNSGSPEKPESRGDVSKTNATKEPDLFQNIFATVSPVKLQAPVAQAATPQKAVELSNNPPPRQSSPLDTLASLLTPQVSPAKVSGVTSQAMPPLATLPKANPQQSQSNSAPQASSADRKVSTMSNNSGSSNESTDRKPTPGKVWSEAEFAKNMSTGSTGSWMPSFFKKQPEKPKGKIISSPEPGVSWVPEMGPLLKTTVQSAQKSRSQTVAASDKSTASSQYWSAPHATDSEKASPPSSQQNPVKGLLGASNGTGNTTGARRALQMEGTTTESAATVQAVKAVKAQPAQATKAQRPESPSRNQVSNSTKGASEDHEKKLTGGLLDESWIKTVKSCIPSLLVPETRNQQIASVAGALALVATVWNQSQQDMYLVDIF